MKLLNNIIGYLTIISAFLGNIQNAEGANILFFHLLVTSSHRIAIWPLAESLADQGHNVTYIWPMANTKQIGTHPKIEELLPSKVAQILSTFVGDFDINIRLENKEGTWLDEIFSASISMCQAFYDSPEIQEWMQRPDIHYDLILIDGSLGECGYGLVHKFKAKLINFSALVPNWLYESLGVIPETSSVPDVFYHPDPDEMTFYKRVLNTATTLWWRYKFLEYVKLLEPVIRGGLNVSSMPSVAEVEASTSLVLVNNYLIEEYPRSLPPMFISFSGLWCSKTKLKAPKPLPNKIAEFIKESDGFFYVSFGSAVKASAMPLTIRNNFFNTFRKFPKHRFLWRWTGPAPEDTPKNVLLLPWFPQNDILAHPKIRGFLTQSGRPSSQEAVCHAIPLITVPIFADQDYNAGRLKFVGASINIDPSELTEKSLTSGFKELLENPQYRNRMKELSSIYRNRPVDSLENVIFWTEFVLRHNDTSMLRPVSIRQPWWKRRLLDVYAFFLTLTLVTLFVGLFIVYKIFSCIFSRIIIHDKIKSE